MPSVSSSQRTSSESVDHPQPDAVLFTGLAGRWYVAHTKPRQEKMLASHLERFGVYNYLPLTQRKTRSPSTQRISRSIVPVFPGYLFFNGSEEQRYRALTTNRIVNVLEVANQGQLIAELTNIHFLLTSTNEFSVQARLKVGQAGRIIAGPLAGLEGIVAGRGSRTRLTLNVTTLGQSVSVEVDADDVEPIDALG
jgi:transcription antitermination factor NusG